MNDTTQPNLSRDVIAALEYAAECARAEAEASESAVLCARAGELESTLERFAAWNSKPIAVDMGEIGSRPRRDTK